MANFTPQEIEEMLQEFFDVVGKRQYVGARYVPIFGRKGEDTITWDNLAPYEPLTVVMHQGVSYVSKQYVPKDVEITDTNYWAETYRFNAQVEQYRQEVLGFQSQIDQMREDMESDYVPFPDSATYPKYGVLGQVLTTLTGGETKWEDPVTVDAAIAEPLIEDWLDNHPEATTTVQDGAITLAKLNDSLKDVVFYTINDRASQSDLSDLDDAANNSVYLIGNYTDISNLPENSVGTLITYGGGRNRFQVYITNTQTIYTRTYIYSQSSWQSWVNVNVTPNGSISYEKFNSTVANNIVYTYSEAANKYTLNDFNSAQPNSVYVIGDWGDIANKPLNQNGALLTFGGSRNKYQLYITITNEIYVRAYKYSQATWDSWNNVNVTPDGSVTISKLNSSLETAMMYMYEQAASVATLPDANNAAKNSIYIIGDYTNIQNLPIPSNGTLLTFGGNRNKSQLYLHSNGCVYTRWYQYSNSRWSAWKSASDISECIMPSTVNVVVGKVYQIELYNIYNEINIENILVDQTPHSGAISYRESNIRIAPTAAGNTNVRLAVNNSANNEILDFVLHAVSDSTKPTVKAMFIGDSLTNAGYYLAELKTMMGNSLTLYGTVETTAKNANDDDVTVHHEGRSGWGLYDMLYRATYKDANNAFYSPYTQQFDFSYYMTQNPTFSDVTDVYIFSGPNDGNTTDYITYLQTMCSSIKTYNSSIRIHICTPTPPNRSGYGFGHENNYNYLIFKTYMYTHAKNIIDTYDGESGYFVVPTHAMIDCYYDFPKTTIQVNPRNPETIEVGNNNVHPNKYGYYRIADTIYADMIANC